MHCQCSNNRRTGARLIESRRAISDLESPSPEETQALTETMVRGRAINMRLKSSGCWFIAGCAVLAVGNCAGVVSTISFESAALVNEVHL